MICPYRAYTNKYVPTLNFFDVNTANSWVKMKKQLKNYGYQFQQRNGLLVISLTAYMGIVYAFSWLNNLGYVKLGKNLTGDLSPFLDIDYFIYTIVNVGVLIYIAKLNVFE